MSSFDCSGALKASGSSAPQGSKDREDSHPRSQAIIVAARGQPHVRPSIPASSMELLGE
jgi:hypothetical protein